MQQTDLIQKLATGALIVVSTALALILVYWVHRRLLAWLRRVDVIHGAHRQQLTTVLQVVQWIVIVVLVSSAILMLLSTFGIDITPLLASAGVAALIISLSAQTLLKDFIGGLLVLIENQYAVGDTISVGNVQGKVEKITLRVTTVRALNGDLHYVPNGEMRVLANMTRDWSRVMLDVGVAYEEDLERARSVLAASAEAFAQDPAYQADLLEAPQVLGPVSFGDSAVIMRVAVKTAPGSQWEIGRALRAQLLAACEREGVELPYPRQEVWVRTAGQDSPAPS
ncbi:MAG: mechanosensitive ion channel family protein [Anaerolineae bacterium]|jgi:small-conductance mechanosensitive channel